MSTNYLDQIIAIYNSPEWKKYAEQGRVNPADEKLVFTKSKSIWAYQDIAGQLEKAKAQDKRIEQSYELATGQKADQSVINKYLSWSDDPANMQALMTRDAFKAPAVGQYNTAIESAIQEKLGGAATDAEKQYFGKQMEAGSLDPYTLNNFIENTSEYQTKASDTARAKLAEELKGVDTSYMGDVEKALARQYAAQGRSGSSAFGSALIKSGQDLAKGRTEYLAGLGYQDFLRGQTNLRSDYESKLAQQYAQQQQLAGLGQESRSRYYAQQDFDRNLAAQQRLIEMQQPKSGSFLQSLIPGLIQSGGNIASAYITRNPSALKQQPTQPSQYYGPLSPNYKYS